MTRLDTPWWIFVSWSGTGGRGRTNDPPGGNAINVLGLSKGFMEQHPPDPRTGVAIVDEQRVSGVTSHRTLQQQQEEEAPEYYETHKTSRGSRNDPCFG